MRKILSLWMALCLLLGAAGVAATSSGRPGHARANAPAAGPLNPARPADRRMLAYGEAHPECRLWTNWEKLCSRTGPGGAVHCNIDPGRRVTPSAPFCTRHAPRAQPNPLAAAERASRLRFCLRPRRVVDGSDGGSGTLTRICGRYEPGRPFNGRRAAALMRPGCDGLSDAETGRPVCVRGGDPAQHVLDCGSFAARHRQSDRLLVCGRWSGPASCHASPVHEWRPPEEGDVTFGAPNPNVAPVHGLFCENR